MLVLFSGRATYRFITLAHTNQDHCSLSGSTLGAAGLDVLDSLLSSLAAAGLSVLLLLGFLCLHGFGLAILDLLGSRVGSLVSVLTGLSLLSADLLDGHTDNSLLDAGGLSGALLNLIVNFNLLVVGSPCHVPGKLHGLDFLVEQAACLGGDEVVSTSILGDESGSASGNNLVGRERASLSLGNHF